MALQSLTYLAGDANGQIHVKHSKRAIGGLEVLVRVTHSGVCGTDVWQNLDIAILELMITVL